MTMLPNDLVLSLFPNSRGIGYVLFEGPLSPFDWGVKEVRGPAKNRRLLAFLDELIDRTSPVILVLKDWTDDALKRMDRVAKLFESILLLAKRKLLKVVRYALKTIHKYFAYRNAFTKYEIALYIAKIIPAFSYQIPRKRKAWLNESARQGLYDAAALGLVFFGSRPSEDATATTPEILLE